MATDDSPFSELHHPNLVPANTVEDTLIEDLQAAIQAMRMQLSRVKWCVELGEDLSKQFSELCEKTSPETASLEERIKMGKLPMWRMIPAKQLVIELRNFEWAYESLRETVNKLGAHREILKSPEQWRAVRREFEGKFPYLKDLRNFISHSGEQTSKGDSLRDHGAQGPTVIGLQIAKTDTLFAEALVDGSLIMTISGKELRIDVGQRTLTKLDDLARRIVKCIKEDDV